MSRSRITERGLENDVKSKTGWNKREGSMRGLWNWTSYNHGCVEAMEPTLVPKFWSLVGSKEFLDGYLSKWLPGGRWAIWGYQPLGLNLNKHMR